MGLLWQHIGVCFQQEGSRRHLCYVLGYKKQREVLKKHTGVL